MSSFLRFAMGAGASIVLLGAIAATSRADIVFNNFGPGDAFSAGGRLLQGESVGTIGNVDQAASFTVGPVGAFLTGITLGISVTGPPNTGTGPLDIILAADAGGSPGAALRTFPLNVNTTGQQTVSVADGGTLLLAGNTTYWVIADAKGTFDGGWGFNSIGDVGLTAGRSNNGPWNLRPDDDRYAFRVEGRLVPEPSALMLVAAIGLVGSSFGCRRRRFRC